MQSRFSLRTATRPAQNPLRLALGLGMCALLHACALSPYETASSYGKQVAEVDRQGVYPTISRKNIEQVNLVELIDPKNRARLEYPDLWKATEPVAGGGAIDFGARYDLALSWFRADPSMGNETKRLIRNGVQERMLAASTSRCNVFKTYLRRDQSNTDFTLGVAATIAGVLGAVLPGATASRNLAGTAGIFSGTRAEYDQAYFSNLAANVIVNGIEKRQSEVQTEIRKTGQSQDITAYPMEAAIRDAIYFDGLCATVVGLNYADAAIKSVSNPGLVEATRIATSVQAMHQIANAPDLKALQVNGDLARLQALVAASSSSLAASITAGRNELNPGTTDPLQAISRTQAEVASAIESEATRVADAYRTIYDKILGSLDNQMAADERANPRARTPDQIKADFSKLLKVALTDKGGTLDLASCVEPAKTMSADRSTHEATLILATDEVGRLKEAALVDAAVDQINSFDKRLRASASLARSDINITGSKALATATWLSAKALAQLPKSDSPWKPDVSVELSSGYKKSICPTP